MDNTPPKPAIISDHGALDAGVTATVTFSVSKDPGSRFTWDGSIGDVVLSGGTHSAICGRVLVGLRAVIDLGSFYTFYNATGELD